MRKYKQVSRLILWAATLLLLCAGAILRDSALPLCAAAFVLCISPGSLLIQLLLRKKLRFTLDVPETAEKNKAVEGTLGCLCAARFLLSGGVSATVAVRNLLTGEADAVDVSVPTAPDRQNETRFSFTSPHCGTTMLTVTRARLYDWLHVFSLRLPCEETKKCTVLPDTFLMEILVDNTDGDAADAPENTPDRPGDDLSELYALREYAPGDEIRLIHWKLSAKTDEVLVRVGSRTGDRRLLLFWDRTETVPEPAARDALAECVVSAAQALSAQKIPFSVGWQEADTIHCLPAGEEEQLLSVFDKLLGGAQEDEAVCSDASLSGEDGFRTAVIFSAGGEGFRLPEGRNTVLRCAADGDFTVNNYQEQLQRIIL